MNEIMEVRNTEHDTPPQDSSFPPELIKEDINESVSTAGVPVGRSARAHESKESSSPAFPILSEARSTSSPSEDEGDSELIKEDIDESVSTAGVTVGQSVRAQEIKESSSAAFPILSEARSTSSSSEDEDDSHARKQFRVLAMVRPTFDDQDFEEFVTVRAKSANNNDDETDRIAKEEAVCRICSENVLEEINLLKTKCKCKLTLLHEKCALEWSANEENKNCDNCKELILCIPVTLTVTTSSGESPRKKRAEGWFQGCFGRKSG